MPTKTGNITFGMLDNGGEFKPLGNIKNIPEISEDEMIETSELPDFTKEWNLEFSIEPAKNHKELSAFIEVFHPNLNWMIWWVNTYGCNNWRKVHGLPMKRSMRK